MYHLNCFSACSVLAFSTFHYHATITSSASRTLLTWHRKLSPLTSNSPFPSPRPLQPAGAPFCLHEFDSSRDRASGITDCSSFCVCLASRGRCPPFGLWHVPESPASLKLSNAGLCEHIAVCPPIHSLMDTWVALTFWPL